MTIKTNTQHNFNQAENDIFSWNTWDGTSGDTLTHKATGREIYQMHWCTNGKMVEPVEEPIRGQARAFWHELDDLKRKSLAELRQASLEQLDRDAPEMMAMEDFERRMDDPNSDL